LNLYFDYRNKCEFTFGKDESGSACVGFRIGSYDDGAIVGRPDDCPNVPKAMKTIANVFTDFLSQTTLPCYDLKLHTGIIKCFILVFSTRNVGVWRTLTCRYSKRTRQMALMLCVQLGDADSHPKYDDPEFLADLNKLTVCLQSLKRQANTDTEIECAEILDDGCHILSKSLQF
jgi:tRNA/tmRNA/rRNA uracil-C5-methylase (TrmA/RlmC/RlmD family)